MNIGFYIHYTSLQAGGIFTYSIRILKLLLSLDSIYKVVLIITAEQKEYFNTFNGNKKLEFSIIDRKKNFTKIRLSISYFLLDNFILYKGYFNDPNRLLFLKRLSFLFNPYRKTLKSNEIDILHIPSQYSPIYGGKIPIVITMHDLQEFHYPEHFNTTERLHRSINTKKAIEESNHVIVSFEHVKTDVIKYFNIDSEKVSVCPPPFADNWFLKKNESAWNELQKKYNLKKKYILYPAATWEHKNHLTLLDAIKNIRDEGPDIELVCTGNKTKYFSILVKKIEDLQLSDSVHFLGIVPEEDLISLYKNSALVVIPTLYEAGSGPLYEAMKYQVPVICSNVTSLPDTVSNNEFLFDPKNVSELVMKIKSGLTDEDFRRKNIENSKQRMEYFRQINYSRNFTEVYKKIIRTG